jgi:hypothetical protein
VGVAVLTFVAGLFVGGVIVHASSSSSSSGSGSTVWTYSQAKHVADAKANASGSGWVPVIGAGIDTPYDTLVPPSSGPPGCVGPGFYIPAYSGNISKGEAPFWLFEYLQNPTQIAPSELLVLVENGSASVLIDLPAGTTCSQYLGNTPPLPASVVDSPTILANAQAAGGASYLAGETGATVTFEVSGGVGGSPPAPATWQVVYMACSFYGVGGATGTHTTFLADFYASNGTESSVTTGTQTCVGDHPYTIGLSAGQSGSLPSGAYYANYSVTIAAPLPLTDLSLVIQSPGGSSVYPASDGCYAAQVWACSSPASGWYATLTAAGILQATFPSAFLSPPGWIGVGVGAITNIQSGETLTLVSTTPLSSTGDVLAMLGANGAVVNSHTTL